VFVGRLLPWKGLALAVAALAEPAAAAWSLDVYGQGPDRDRCARLAERLGVAGRVAFLGHQPREAVLGAFATADAMLFPSMHDSGGFVVAEALSLGCPVVCLDRAGPGVLVQDGWGAKVPVGTDAIPRLAEALGRITARIPPVHRWDTDRLSDYCDHWYAGAVAAGAPRAP
jgi:glycosyltransferase involved in cell wall biosynthesis